MYSCKTVAFLLSAFVKIQFFKMIFLPGYFVLFVSFVYFGPASSKPLEPTPIHKLNQALLEINDTNYQGYLVYSIPAASAGKNFFKMPDGLSEDCIRTARTIMQLYAKLSISKTVLYVMKQSYTKAVKSKSNGLFQKQVNTTCKNLNKEAKKWLSDFSNFEELKRDVELPKPEKNYIYEVPSDQNIHKWLGEAPMNYEDPEMFKFKIILQFQILVKSEVSAKNNLDNISTGRAIEQLSMSTNFKSTVDNVFAKALQDYTKDIFVQNTDKFDAAHSTAFVKKLDQYFLKNFVLKEEYKEIKKRVIDEIKNPSLDE